MSNPDARFGLRPVRRLDGTALGGAIKCFVDSDYATALFVGDPVDYDTTLANVPTAGKYPTVILSAFTDGTYAMGSIVAIEADPDNLGRAYLPASTGGYVYVQPSPGVVFHVRDDGGAALSKVTIGQNAVGIFTHAGDTATGLSGMELDAGTTTAPSANASNTMYILGPANIPDNEWDGSTDTHVVWEVLINMPRFGGATGDGDGALGLTSA